MPKSLPISTLLRGSFFFFFASFLVNILSYVLNLIVVRGFSIAQYGEYATAFAYVAILTVPVQAMSMLIIRKIGGVAAAERQSWSLGLEKWLIKQFQVLGLPLLVLSAVLSSLMIVATELRLASIGFIIGLVFLTGLVVFYTSIFQAQKALITSSGLSLLLGIFKIVGGAAVVISWPTLAVLYASLLLAHVLIVGLGYLRLHQKIRPRSKSQVASVALPSLWTLTSRTSIWVPILASLGLMGLINVDVMLVKQFFSPEAAGWYAALALLAKVILYAATPISALAYTFLTDNDHQSKFVQILIGTELVMLAMGAVATALYYFFPELIINLVFGSRYLVISQFLWIAGVFGTIFSLVNLNTQYFVSQQSKLAVLTILGMGAQLAGIWMWHSTFIEVLFVNVMVAGVLLALQIVGMILREG